MAGTSAILSAMRWLRKNTMNDSERLEQLPVDTAGLDDVPPDALERDLSMGPVLERIRSHPDAEPVHLLVGSEPAEPAAPTSATS